MNARSIARASRVRSLFSVALGVACCVGVATGCAGGPGEPDGSAAEWVAWTRGAHERVDAALARGDAQAAKTALRRALDAPAPREIDAEDARVARQDLWFRLAEVETQLGAPREALAASERGLGLGRAQDVFTANLFIARGRALEALHRDTEAAASYYEALVIDDRLLAARLEPDAGAP